MAYSFQKSFDRLEIIMANMRHISHFPVTDKTGGMTYVRRKNYFLADHGLPSFVSISPMRSKISGSLQSSKVFLSRPIPMHVICSAYLSRKPKRYRSLPSRSKIKTLSHGHSWQYLKEHARRRQRNTRLENICRLRSNSHSYSPSTICQRRLRGRSQRNCLRSRRYHYRSLSLHVSVGQISKKQRRRQTSYSFRSSWLYSNIHQYQRWEGSRRQCSRRAYPGTWSFLHHGQRLSRFRKALSSSPVSLFLRHPGKIQPRFQKNLFSSCRQINRPQMRSNNKTHGLLHIPTLPGVSPPHQILRQRNRQSFYIFNEQFPPASIYDHQALQMSMASRTLLQMDQTTSENQSFLWHVRERRQNTNMDRCKHICSRGHHQETAKNKSESLHNSTDFERDPFRENAHPATVCGWREYNIKEPYGQPTEIIQLTTGH